VTEIGRRQTAMMAMAGDEGAAMRVTADRQVCVGAGMCVLTAPDVFDQDDDGVVTVLRPTPTDGEQGAVREAVELCPSGAVKITD
jgi:ferredoxin